MYKNEMDDLFKKNMSKYFKQLEVNEEDYIKTKFLINDDVSFGWEDFTAVLNRSKEPYFDMYIACDRIYLKKQDHITVMYIDYMPESRVIFEIKSEQAKKELETEKEILIWQYRR